MAIKRYHIAVAICVAMLSPLLLLGALGQVGVRPQGDYPWIKAGRYADHVCLFVRQDAFSPVQRFALKDNTVSAVDEHDCPDDPRHHIAVCPNSSDMNDQTCIALLSVRRQIEAAHATLRQTQKKLDAIKADLVISERFAAGHKGELMEIRAGIAWLTNAATAIVFVFFLGTLAVLALRYLPQTPLFARFIKGLDASAPEPSDTQIVTMAPSPGPAQPNEIATAIKGAEAFLHKLNEALRDLHDDPDAPKQGADGDSPSMTGSVAAQAETAGLDDSPSAEQSLSDSSSDVSEIFEAILVLVKSARDARRASIDTPAPQESESASQVSTQAEPGPTVATEQAVAMQVAAGDRELHKTLLSLKSLAEKIIATQRKHASEMTGLRRMLIALTEEIRSEKGQVMAAVEEAGPRVPLLLSTEPPENIATGHDSSAAPAFETSRIPPSTDLPGNFETIAPREPAVSNELDVLPRIRVTGFEVALAELARELYGDRGKSAELDRMLKEELTEYPARYIPRPNWPADVDTALVAKTMATLRIIRIDRLGGDPTVALTKFAQRLLSNSARILNPKIGGLIDSRYHSRADRISDAASNVIGAIRWAGLQFGDVVLMRAGIVDFVVTG